MPSNEYTREVNITPLGTAYAWDAPPSWIDIEQVGSTNNWKITVSANVGTLPRAWNLIVRHNDGSTTDTINVSQAAATVATPTATPVPPTATPVPPTATPTSYYLDFVASTFNINDLVNGAGSSVNIAYNMGPATGWGSLTPTLVEKDSRLGVVIQSTSGISGWITVTSLMGPQANSQSVLMVPDLKIAHPLDSNVTASISGSITVEGSNKG